MSTTTKSRQSGKAAGKAEAGQGGAGPCIHDLDPATCAECNGMAAEQAKAETQPEQPTMPYAEVTGTEVHIPVYRGVVQVVAASLDGGTEVIETIECGCKWAHTTPEIAIRCGRKLAAGRGLRIGAPEA